MARLDVRCDLSLPVEILLNSSSMAHHRGNAVNIGLGGAFISANRLVPENSVVELKVQIPDYGSLQTKGKVIRKQAEGFALKFLNLDTATKANLWDYISGNLYEPFNYSDNGGSSDAVSPMVLPMHRAEEISFRLKILDKATEGFNKGLADLERRHEEGENLETLLEELRVAIFGVCDVCRGLEEAIGDNEELLGWTRNQFRGKTNHFLSKSHLVNHARTWPKGYPGDYKMIESIYRNIPLSVGIGYPLDMYFLSSTLATAVRGRLEKLKEILKEELARRENPRVLNIAGGSCREIFELVPEIAQSRASVICLDTDSDALAFASNRLSYASDIWSDITLRKYNAIRMLNHERNLKEFGEQDIIYSIGLVNYLPDDTLVRLLESLYALLKPKGKLIVGIEDGSRYRPQEYRWFVDWVSLIGRTAHDSGVIFGKAGIPESALEMVRDSSSVIIFCVAEKQ